MPSSPHLPWWHVAGKAMLDKALGKAQSVAMRGPLQRRMACYHHYNGNLDDCRRYAQLGFKFVTAGCA